MKKNYGFIPLLSILIIGTSIAITTILLHRIITQHWLWQQPQAETAYTYNNTPTNAQTTTNNTNTQACTVISLVKGQQGFKGTALPLLFFKRYQDGSTDIVQEKFSNPTCLTCNAPIGAPGEGKYKTLPVWFPNKQFILFAAEADSHPPFSTNRQSKNEQIQNGWWGNLWVMTPDGSKWFQLTHYSTATDGTFFGVLAPIASNNKVVWAKFIGRPSGKITMGGWKLYAADLVVNNGTPSLANIKNISAPNSTIFEPQDFSPDGSKFLVSQDTNMPNPYGWDTYIYDATTGTSINLNNTPDQWDEHARFSPDGTKIVWATSSPYSSTVANVQYGQYATQYLKTEFWLMNADGSNQKELTFLNTPGHAEYTGAKEIANVPTWSADGTQILAGVVPGGKWLLSFSGSCGQQ